MDHQFYLAWQGQKTQLIKMVGKDWDLFFLNIKIQKVVPFFFVIRVLIICFGVIQVFGLLSQMM